jgi:hypothetical protein
MRNARPGRERYVVQLMNKGLPDEAVAYMKRHGMIQAFVGAPGWKPVSVPEPVPIQSSPDAYRYPEFKPVRDPVPEGVKWARVKRELGNELQKVMVLEDDFDLPEHKRREVLAWMSLREQQLAGATRGRLIGQTFPIEKNPDERQGGWRVWRR